MDVGKCGDGGARNGAERRGGSPGNPRAGCAWPGGRSRTLLPASPGLSRGLGTPSGEEVEAVNLPAAEEGETSPEGTAARGEGWRRRGWAEAAGLPRVVPQAVAVLGYVAVGLLTGRTQAIRLIGLQRCSRSLAGDT